MARQSPNRPDADEPAADVAAGVDSASSVPASSDSVGSASAAGSAAGGGRALWEQTRVSPVEIALPGGVGLTLRAYRRSAELTPTEVDTTAEEDPFDARERAAADRAAEEDGDEEVVILDEEFAALMAEDDTDAKAKGKGKGDTADGDAEEPDPADFEDEPADKADKADEADEEVPVFLSHRGRLLLFKTPESLVSFIRSGAPHDMTQLDTWATVAERVQVTDMAPAEDDSYELDLVVENLRGGHDTWDLPLLIQAGEVARDLGYALRLKPVIMALAAGSPLDDLDDSLRSAAGGGMGGFFGKRRLRKIGAQQASLGWRSIIGKISAAVDWRD